MNQLFYIIDIILSNCSFSKPIESLQTLIASCSSARKRKEMQINKSAYVKETGIRHQTEENASSQVLHLSLPQID